MESVVMSGSGLEIGSADFANGRLHGEAVSDTSNMSLARCDACKESGL